MSPFLLLRRTLVLLALLLWQGVRWWIGWVVLVCIFAGQNRRKIWFGQCLLDLFRHLGMTFIKVGQIMSTRPDLVPEYITQALIHLQDNVGPFPYEEVERTILEDLGQPVSLLFAEFSLTPLASASVAQVHKARLHDGQIVAVKVRRPDAAKICTFDLAVMRFVAKLLGKLPSLRFVSPESAVDQFGRAIEAQLDFRIEAANNRRFRSNFMTVPEVEFPVVIESMSSERILCMTYIDGTKILHARRGHFDTTRIARLGMHTLMKMIFEDGFIHADLHPGNIFVLPGNRIALVDLGLVGELDASHRAAFSRFFRAWAERDGKTMANLLYSLATNPTKAGEEILTFQTAVMAFMARHWSQKMSEVHTGKLLLEMLGLLRRHRIRMVPAFTIVNIAIAVTEGIAKQLDPDLDLMGEAIPFFMAHPTLLDPSHNVYN